MSRFQVPVERVVERVIEKEIVNEVPVEKIIRQDVKTIAYMRFSIILHIRSRYQYRKLSRKKFR